MGCLRATIFRSSAAHQLICSRWLGTVGGTFNKTLKNHERTGVRLLASEAGDRKFISQLLVDRTLLRISGKDTSGFLQGILTNDMECLHDNRVNCGRTLYSLMLNVQGRVLYDLILYAVGKPHNSSSEEQSDHPITDLFMECNSDVEEDLMKVMKRYKIRKKVNISRASDEYRVWALMPENSGDPQEPPSVKDASRVMTCEPDPRLKSLGFRAILPTGVTASEVLAGVMESEDDMHYRAHRYQLGVAEGSTELPPGNCLPLESNAVFLNGVSFNKGCYVGQELTARTYHTGLTRKRIMPITLSNSVNITSKISLENVKGKRSGTLRGSVGRHGVALLRLPDVVGKGPLTLRPDDAAAAIASDPAGPAVLATATASIPTWWQTQSDAILKQVLADNPSFFVEKA